MQAYLLGIDIGTGSTKSVAVTYNGQSLGISQHYYPIKNPQPGYSEQEPQLIYDAFVACINDIVLKLGYAPQAISFSSAMHSIMPVDVNGNALADMLTWADARSEAIAQKLRDTNKGEYLYKTCGTAIHAMSPLCKSLWLKENEPGLFTETHKFIGIKEYIWHKLFGVFEVDYAIASSTGMFDIKKLEWNMEALSLAGITNTKLSNPVNTTYKRSGLIPAVSKTLNLPADTAFIIGASDGCCANLGSYITEGIASLTIGTSGAVRITSPQPVYNYEAMVFNYLLNQKTFVCGGAVNNGGIVLQWLLKTFLDNKLPGHNEYDEAFERMATIPAGSDGLIFLPYLYGERSPLWDTKSCGMFFNIKPIHTPAHFLRAGLEGICFALNNVLQTLQDASAPIHQLNISGGFITSKVWTQMLADITGKKLAIVQQEDASALGAIFLAMDSLDIQRDKNKTDEEKFIVPDAANYAIYNNNFKIFKKLYVDLKDTMHLMHDIN
jgi:gluconokinase